MTKKHKDNMSLNLGGHNYEIVLDPLEDKAEPGKVLYGQHLVELNVILINSTIEQSRQEETLIHEVLHSIHYNSGLEHDERQIEAISNGLFQLGVGGYLWKKAQKKS